MNLIPKIEMKITVSELKAICTAIDFELPQITYTGDQEKQMKSYYSIFIQVRNKLAKKQISHQFMIKPFKLSLEFYEAWALYKTLEVIKLDRKGQNFFNQLDQKLA